MQYQKPTHPWRADAVRPLVRKAFRELRKNGLLCRMSFKDCSSCAGAILEPMAKKCKSRGVVYFHQQDNSSFTKGYDLHIRYSMVGNGTDKAWAALGHEVTKALKKQGLVVEWNGDTGSTVVVKSEKSYDRLRAQKVT